MITPATIVSIIVLSFCFLFIKHQIIDWMWQPAFEHQNKGKFLHWGGIRHAGKNAIGTGLVLSWFFGPIGIPLALLDFVIHYITDWSKVNINNHYGLKPDQHPEFWWLTGLDQTIHLLTYAWLVYLGGLVWIDTIYR